MAPKPKSSAAAAAQPQPPPQLEDLFTTLNRHIQSSSFDSAVRLADQILAVAPADEDALRCKVVALIKADKFDPAISAIHSSCTPAPDFHYLKAYCLYRQNKLDEALESLKGQERSEESMLLEAQILYRLGKMDACIDIYGMLQKSKIDNLEINSVASLIMAGRSSEVQGTLDSLQIKATSSFELAYNTACSLIERKKYTDAEQLLLSGRRIGQEILMEDNLADDEIELELAPIAVQLAYVQQARELVSGLPDMFPESVTPVLLQAALLVRENKAGRAKEILEQFAGKFPEKSKVVCLARAQVAAAAGHPHIAADSLAKISEIQHTPATLATLVSLEERAGDIEGATAVLDSAIKWWSNAMTEDNKLNVIMQEAASFKLRHGNEEDAARLFEGLVKSQGSIEALVGLVTTVLRMDVDKAELYEKQLMALPGLKGINMDSLERTSGAKQVNGPIHVGVSETPEEGKSKTKAKNKRKRKPRYPKGFDSANPGPPPDPERWLPRQERLSYRPKRKDKRAAQVRGSQGAVVRDKHVAGASSNNSNPKSNHSAASKPPKEPRKMQHLSKTKPSSKSRKKSRNQLELEFLFLYEHFSFLKPIC